MKLRPTEEILLQRCERQNLCDRRELVAVEEPLEIRIGKQRVAVLMRTPGDDLDLAAGFLLTERILSDPAQVSNMSYCQNVPLEQRGNILVVHPDPDTVVTIPQRNFNSVSSCGICGKASIDELVLSVAPICDSLQISSDVLHSLTGALYQAQNGFAATGGLHAAGIFSARGELLCAREDVGRHNAVDKVIGAMAGEGQFPLAGKVLLCSGRASFEIVQKAAVARIPVVVAISAPSSLAIALARRLGITLVGFLRDDHYNVYSCPERIRRPGQPGSR